MKGKRSLKRILAVLMAVVFTISGITYSPKTVSANLIVTNWTQVSDDTNNAKIVAGDMWFYQEYYNHMDYNITDHGRSIRHRDSPSGGMTSSYQVGLQAYDQSGTAKITDTDGKALVSGTSYAYTITFEAATAGGTLRYKALRNSSVEEYTIVAGENTITGTAIYSGISKTSDNGGTLALYMELKYIGYNQVFENIDIEITPYEEAPDLTTVQSHTPNIDNMSGWTSLAGGNNANNNNAWYGADHYYIASDYMAEGTYNTFFYNHNIYGIYGTGSSVNHLNCPSNHALYSIPVYAINSSRISGIVASVWVDGVKLPAGHFYNGSNDVMAIDLSDLSLSSGQTKRIFIITVRTTSGADYSWPIMVRKGVQITTTNSWLDVATGSSTITSAWACKSSSSPQRTNGQTGLLNLSYATTGGASYLRTNGLTDSDGDALVEGESYRLTYNIENTGTGTNAAHSTMYILTGKVVNGNISNSTLIAENTANSNIYDTSGTLSSTKSFAKGYTMSGITDTFTANGTELFISIPYSAPSEITIKTFTVSKVDGLKVPASYSASCTAANTATVSWTEDAAVSAGQTYAVYLDNSVTPVTGMDSIASSGAGQTITRTLTGLSEGSHTVTIRTSLNGDTDDVTTDSFLVYAASTDPTNVTASEYGSEGQKIAVSITATGAPSYQTYNIYYKESGDSSFTQAATGVSAGTNYISVPSTGTYSIKVTGKNGTLAESSGVTVNNVVVEWNKVSSSSSQSVGGWVLYASNNASTGMMAYKGSSQANLNLRVDASRNVTGTTGSPNYDLQIKKSYANLYSGLTSGVNYTMIMTMDIDLPTSGTGGFVYQDGSNHIVSVSSDGTYSITREFTCPASPSSSEYFTVLLDGLPAGTVVNGISVNFVAAINPASVIGIATGNNDEITVTWTAGMGALTGTVYDIYIDDDSSSPVATNVLAASSPFTISNLDPAYRGIGHTVTVVPKYTYNGTTYTNTGTESSAFMIKGPIDIDTFSDNINTSNESIDIYWSDPTNACSGQIYNVYVNGVLHNTGGAIAAPTSASPYSIGNVTNGTNYTIKVTAVYNGTETTVGTTRTITYHAVDSTWTSTGTTSNAYIWPNGGYGLGFFDSPNLYYKLGDPSTGSQSSTIMSIKNINSTATAVNVLSSAIVANTSTTSNFTITMTFTSDVADSTGGNWKYGLKNANNSTSSSWTQARTITNGTNTYTKTFSYTTGSGIGNRTLNGLYQLDIPSGATIEIKSFTITNDDTNKDYSSYAMQDYVWHPVDVTTGTSKWYYKMPTNSYNNSSMGFKNAQNYGETSTGAGDGFNFYNPAWRPNTYGNVFLSTGDISSLYNMEAGKLYDVKVKMTVNNLSSSSQSISLRHKGSLDATPTAITSHSFASGISTYEMTGQVQGRQPTRAQAGGLYLELFASTMQQGSYTVDSIEITEKTMDLTDVIAAVADTTNYKWTYDTFWNGQDGANAHWSPDYRKRFSALTKQSGSGINYFITKNTTTGQALSSSSQYFLSGNYYGYYSSPAKFPYGEKGIVGSVETPFTNPLSTAGAGGTAKPILAFTSEKIRSGNLYDVYLSDNGATPTRLTSGTDYFQNPINSDVLMVDSSLFALGNNESEHIYYLVLRTLSNSGTDYYLPIRISKVDDPDIDHYNQNSDNQGYQTFLAGLEPGETPWTQFNVSTASITGGKTSTTSANGSTGYKWSYDTYWYGLYGQDSNYFGHSRNIGYLETQDSRNTLYVDYLKEGTAAYDAEALEVRTNNPITVPVFAMAVLDDAPLPDTKWISEVWVDDESNNSTVLVPNLASGYTYYRYEDRLYFPQSLFVPQGNATSKTTYITIRYIDDTEICIPIHVVYEDTPTAIADSAVTDWTYFAYTGLTESSRRSRATSDETAGNEKYRIYVSDELNGTSILGPKVMIGNTDNKDLDASPMIGDSDWMMGAYPNTGSVSNNDRVAGGSNDAGGAWGSSRNAFTVDATGGSVPTLSFITGKASTILCTQNKYLWIQPDGGTPVRYEFDGTNNSVNNDVSYHHDTVHIKQSVFTEVLDAQTGANKTATKSFTVTMRLDYQDYQFKVMLERMPNLTAGITHETSYIPNSQGDGLYYVGDTATFTITTTNDSLLNVTDSSSTGFWVDNHWVNNAYRTISSLNSGATNTWSNIYYTPATSGNHTFEARVDYNNNVEESNETIADNRASVDVKFYPQPITVTLTNDGTNVVATWDAPSDENMNPQAAKIRYTDAAGTTHEVDLANVGITSYTFPSNVYLANESAVTVLLSENPEELEPIWYKHAIGEAKADLVVVDFRINADTAETMLHPNINYTFVGTVKNIGTAVTSYAAGADVNKISLSYDMYSDEEHTQHEKGNWGASVVNAVINPNATLDITASDNGHYTPTTVGMKYAVVKVDTSDRVVESINYNPVATTNNISNYTFEVADSLVEVVGFQINTNTDEGGVSEYMPSIRAVSRYSADRRDENEYFYVNGTTHTVYEFGTIVAWVDRAGDIDETTMIRNSSNSDIQTVVNSTKIPWGGKEDRYTYFPTTLKEIRYNYDKLQTNYAFRAYVVLDNANGQVVYSDDIVTVNTYDIAEDLYQNQKMHTKAHHDFLYDKVLNVVALHEHAAKIGTSMFKALGITSASHADYPKINALYKDIVYYTECTTVFENNEPKYSYSYGEQGDFTCKALSSEDVTDLLSKLNTARETDYEDIMDWIYNETPKIKNSSNVPYPGCYTKVNYDWENYLYPPAIGQNEGFSSSE